MMMTHFARSHMVPRIMFLAFLLVTVVIALYPELKLPEPKIMRGSMDLVYHVSGFTLLAVIGGLAWPSAYGVMMGLTLGAVVLELAQYISPGRGVHLHDIVANLSGIACGMAVLFVTSRVRRMWFRDNH